MEHVKGKRVFQVVGLIFMAICLLAIYQSHFIIAFVSFFLALVTGILGVELITFFHQKDEQLATAQSLRDADSAMANTPSRTIEACPKCNGIMYAEHDGRKYRCGSCGHTHIEYI